jgi:hypothetical protein
VEVDPARVLNPTNFDKPEQLGAVIFRRFWQEIRDEKILIVGSSPFLRDYDRVWRVFLQVAAKENITFGRVFAQADLRDLGVKAEPLDWEAVQVALAGPDRILVHLVSTDEMLNEAQTRTMRGLILFQDLLPVKAEAIQLLQSRCGENDKAIACVALKALSHGKKRKFSVDKLTAVVEKHGRREHYLFVHEP